ncbi:hypothetical protein Tco_1184322 [Tanacetum coccineum]
MKESEHLRLTMLLLLERRFQNRSMYVELPRRRLNKHLKLLSVKESNLLLSSHASGSGADEGTGVKPGVPDVPTYGSDDEKISWKSSEEEDDNEVAMNDDDDDNDDDNDNVDNQDDEGKEYNDEEDK